MTREITIEYTSLSPSLYEPGYQFPPESGMIALGQEYWFKNGAEVESVSSVARSGPHTVYDIKLTIKSHLEPIQS